MRLTHRVRTSASPAQVWELLGSPSRWPECELLLRRVRGTRSTVEPGQHLVGILRGVGLGIPLDVLESVPHERLVVRARVVPGVTTEVTVVLTPTMRGGTVIALNTVVDGAFAHAAWPVAWLAEGLTARVLVRRTTRDALRDRRVPAQAQIR